jgi:hypothetical protein
MSYGQMGQIMQRFEPTAFTAFSPALEVATPPTTFGQLAVNDSLSPIEANRLRVTEGQTPTLNVIPYNPDNPNGANPDIVVGPGGITVRPGLQDAEGLLAQYTIGVAPGASQEDIQRAVTLTADMMLAHGANHGITLTDATHVLDDNFARQFRDAHPINQDPNDRLPDNPHVPDGGGGGGGCGPRPHPDVPPDQPDRDDPNNPNQPDAATRGLRRLEDWTRNLTREGADMHALHYGNWLLSILPRSILDKIARFGPPPWTAEQMAEIETELAKPETQQAITQSLTAQETALRAQGDIQGANAIGAFRTQLQEALADPTKRHQFVQSLSNFMGGANAGTANATDIRALFNDNPAVQQAIRHLLLLQQARQLNPGGGSGPLNLENITPEQLRQIIQRLHGRPTGGPLSDVPPVQLPPDLSPPVIV